MKTSGNIWDSLRDRAFAALAPMDDVTDSVFRRLVHEIAPADVYFTEFANADGYMSVGRPAIERRLRLSQPEGPVIVQIWGINPENFRAMAADMSQRGFVGIDLNMGCPVKDVVKKGACSALIRTPDLAIEMIAATKAGAPDLPVSVKTRLGTSQFELDWIQTLLEQDIPALTVHLRTVKEQSKVPAHWDLMPEIIKLRDAIAPQTLIIGNGDVEDRHEAELRMEQTGCDGVMIGRGIFHNPWAFATVKEEHSREERLMTLQRHLDIWEEELPADERARRFETLKRFFKIYVSEFAGAADLRHQLMQCHSIAEARMVLA